MGDEGGDEIGRRILKTAVNGIIEDRREKARLLLEMRILNKNPRKNIDQYCRLVADVTPEAFALYGLDVEARLLNKNGIRRVVFIDKHTDKPIFFSTVKIHDFFGRKGTECLALLPFKPTGDYHHSVFDSREHTPKEVVGMAIKASGIDLLEGDDESNKNRVIEVEKRADFALKLALMNDKPKAHITEYRDLLTESIPDILKRRFVSGVEVEKQGKDMFIVSTDEGVLFMGEIKVHKAFSETAWIVVHPISSAGESAGSVIDSRSNSLEEVVAKCLNELR